MSHIVIARKFRPQKFNDLIGQDHVVKTLQNAISSDHIAHAYLFSGIRGVGKTTAARIFAKALNCLSGPTPTPCDKCSNCTSIKEGNLSDVLEIDGASNRGIDEVRQLRENVRYLPAQSKYKIYIIDEVHMLTQEAFNALLKTIEEPPPHVIFILATTQYHKVPDTILSRCQKLDFRRIAYSEIIKLLADIAKKESISIDEESLSLIATQSEGSMRDAESILEQLRAYSSDKITPELIYNVLGIFERKALFSLCDALFTKNIKEIIKIVGDIYSQGHDLSYFLSNLIEALKNCLILAVSKSEVGLELSLTKNEITLLSGLISKRSYSEIDQMLEILISAYNKMQRHEMEKIILEINLIRAAYVESIENISSLIAGISQGKTDFGSREPAKTTVQTANQNIQNLPPSVNGFLDFLATKKPALHSLLTQEGIVVSDDANTFTIKFQKNSFISQKISEHADFIKSGLKEYFKRDVKLNISETALVSKPIDYVRKEHFEKEKLKDDVKSRPEVKNIMDSFNANLIKVERK